MASIDTLVAFFITTAVFAYIPGPAMLYAAAQTVAWGRRSGLSAVLGIHLGCYVHVLAAAAGLSLVFHAVPLLYTAVKLAGAAYLIWLGITMLRARDDGAGPADAIQPTSVRRAFVQSVRVEVLNPKTALFFLAFLPQFVDPGAALPVWLQFAILGTAVNLLFTSADVVCVIFAGAMIRRLRASRYAKIWMQRAGGAVLVGLGAHLALQRQ
ncbi:LysE family translocator [Rhizobium halophilum]|uniref:LysE family translocator n=1 Tax=Rhizobium halophilum TaxID=2846852 RepID=UPI001EFCE509|nr:LysE family translocator [Rhizobium halophilum]MCF6367477.1 LysE family translocator [Rhizobium halophilum]